MSRWLQKPPLGSMIEPGHPLATGLVFCLLFNERNGDPRDISGNGNHGKLMPDAVTGPRWVPERNGSAISFDGVDDYILISHGGRLSFLTGDFSIVIKGNIRSFTNYFGFISADTNIDVAWKIRYDFGGHYMTAQYSTATLNYPFVLVNQWHGYGYVKKGTTLGIFFDGIYSNSGPCPATNSGNATELILGSYRIQNGKDGLYLLPGLIDAPLIYNRALTTQEIWQLYNDPWCFIHQPRKYWVMPNKPGLPWPFLRRVA